jgi:hypothetical protein
LTKQYEIIIKISPLEYYILNTLAQNGIDFKSSFKRAMIVLGVISKKQSKSNEVVIRETSANGVSRIALVFGDSINLNSKYSRGISRWILLRSFYKQVINFHYYVFLVTDERAAINLFKLKDRYQTNYPKWTGIQILNIGLRLYFEMYCGAKLGSTFDINGEKVLNVY